jgi:toxin ParE1/3/4
MIYRITSAARHDLREIAIYIARDNPERAVSYVKELTDKIQSVAEQPMLYSSRDGWKPGLRSALHRPYHIIFRIEGDEVIFLRVVHGARDLVGLLGD